MTPTTEQLTARAEGQTFDRKSIRIAAKDLAVIMIAFANADGVDIAVGIGDDRKLEGVDNHEAYLHFGNRHSNQDV